MSEEMMCKNETLETSMNHDLAYLKDFCVHEVNGARYLGDTEMPFNVSYISTESEFVRDWLIQFALGAYYGVNYFNQTQWFKMTNNGRFCVLVVDDMTRDPMFIVNSLVSNNLDAQDRDILGRVNTMFSNIHFEADNKEIGNRKTAKAVPTVLEHLSNNKRTLTDLVPDWFYKKHNINPITKQNTFYVRDVVRKKLQTNSDDLVKLEEIFIKELDGQSISKEEADFVTSITLGQYQVKHSQDGVSFIPQFESAEGQDFDPLEC